MKIQDSEWQGCFGYWQNLLIQQNILTIGYTAWQGFLSHGRGLVMATVTALPSAIAHRQPADFGNLREPLARPVSFWQTINWHTDVVCPELQFAPAAQAMELLKGLKVEPDVIAPALGAIATYQPAEEIVLLLYGSDTTDLNLLRNLAIPPEQCYAQVNRRWGEF
jgi:hypothetical protein